MVLLMLRSAGRPQIDSTHWNPIVHVVTWVLLAITTMALIFRLLTRCYLREKRNFGWEDGLILCSYTFTLIQSITMLLPDSQALGSTGVGLSSASINSSLKLYYISNLFLILSLGFAKLSVCAGFLTLSPFHHRITYCMGVGIILWILSTLFSSAFQCNLPQPWNHFSQKCADRLAILRFIIITNIITDIVLIVFPITVIMTIRMPSHKRFAIMSLFFARVLAIGAAAAQLVYVGRQVADDYFLAIFPYLICTQVVQCTSMSSACVVYIWPFLKALQSGLLWSDNTASSSFSPTINSKKWFSGTFDSKERRKGGRSGQLMALTIDSAVRSEPTEIVSAKQGNAAGPHRLQSTW